MTTQEFGKTIKEKYPQYQDMDDAVLGQKMLERYPQYADLVTVPEIPQKSTTEKVLGGIASVTGGGEIARGFAQTLSGRASGLSDAAGSLTQTTNQLITSAKKLPIGDPRRKQLLQQAQQMSANLGNEASSFMGDLPTNKQVLGSAGKLAITATTLGTPGLSSGLTGGVGVTARSVEMGVTGATFKALDNLEQQKNVGEGVLTAGVIGAAIPLVGAGLSKAKSMLGKATTRTGEKIQESIIKPSSADIKDGFSATNINKYKLGGSLQDMAKNTDSKIQQLSKELASKIKRSDATLDLNSAVKEVTDEMLKNKSANFGNSQAVKRVLAGLGQEVEDVSTNGLVDLSEAQLVKQAAGKKGAWVFGNADPDSSAVERVYTAFYRNLKKKIEDAAPAGIREINKQLSDLIPISHAIIRRIPVAERNNILSLTDLISLGASAVNPWALTLFGANRLSKSGTFGSMLSRFGENIVSRPATTNIGKRIFK